MPAHTATADADPAASSTLISAFTPFRRADPPTLYLVSDTDTGDTGLLERFAHIPDHRQIAWVDHPLPAVLALCAGAVVAGMASFTAIAGWIADASEKILTCAYAGSGQLVPTAGPSRITLWRVLTGLDATALDTAIGDWLLDQAYAEIQASDRDAAPPETEDTTCQDRTDEPAGRLAGVAIAADGKTCRGSKTVDGKPIHLLSVMTHDTRLVLNQIEVGAKTNEVRHEAPCRIPDSVGMNSEGGSWARRLTWIRKVKGTKACRSGHRPCPDAGSGAVAGPRDMAKAGLLESQSPVMQVFIHRKWRLKPVLCPVSVYLVGGCTFRDAGDAQ